MVTSRPDRCAPAGGHDDDLFDLWPVGGTEDLQNHRAALVYGLPATLGTVRQLRGRQTNPRWNPDRAAVRDVYPPRPVVLAVLPGLRAAPVWYSALPAVRPSRTAARAAQRRQRRGPCRTSGPVREPGQQPATQHHGELAEQEQGFGGAGRAGRRAASPDPRWLG